MSAPLLEVVNLTKRYHGTVAVDDLSFAVRRGTITGLIGPNGSGKSTTIDCISGFAEAASGSWSLDGVALQGRSPEAHARGGCLRSFQMVRAYEDLSVLDNLLVAVQEHQGVGWWASLLRTPALRRTEALARRDALAALGAVNLLPYADAPAQVLSYGQRKLLSIAAMLLARPKLAVLDEPVAGINPTMIGRVTDAVRQLRAGGTTILLVEHNMEVIMSLCDHVIVLVAGRLLVEGPPALVRRDPRVLDAYLGTGVEQTGVTAPILAISGLSAGYGEEAIVEDVTLDIAAGSITTLIGANGAGKSTLLKAIYGLNRRFAGSVALDGQPIDALPPAARLRAGLGFVPQGRCNFPLMSVQENLALGTWTLPPAERGRATARMVALFPVLGEKARVAAGNLSGGEQQVLEMAMVLMTAPRVLLLDEPSIGLSPRNLGIVLRTIAEIRRTGTTVLMVEQNVKGALAISDTAVVMELGRILAQGPAAAIAADPAIAQAYLGAAPA